MTEVVDLKVPCPECFEKVSERELKRFGNICDNCSNKIIE